MNWLEVVKSKNSTKQWYKTMGQFKGHTGTWPLTYAKARSLSKWLIVQQKVTILSAPTLQQRPESY